MGAGVLPPGAGGVGESTATAPLDDELVATELSEICVDAVGAPVAGTAIGSGDGVPPDVTIAAAITARLAAGLAGNRRVAPRLCISR